MNVILTEIKLHFLLVYFVDIVIYSKSLAEHIVFVVRVLKLLNDMGVILRLKE